MKEGWGWSIEKWDVKRRKEERGKEREGKGGGERRKVGQAEGGETRKRASGSIYTFCKLGLLAIYEIISA